VTKFETVLIAFLFAAALLFFGLTAVAYFLPDLGPLPGVP
jgi:hypothetical protein